MAETLRLPALGPETVAITLETDYPGNFNLVVAGRAAPCVGRCARAHAVRREFGAFSAGFGVGAASLAFQGGRVRRDLERRGSVDQRERRADAQGRRYGWVSRQRGGWPSLGEQELGRIFIFGGRQPYRRRCGGLSGYRFGLSQRRENIHQQTRRKY